MQSLHRPGEIIQERYEIVDILGQGGVGITYGAIDTTNDEKIALKVLSLRRMNDWKRMELFEREANILSQLNHHAIPRYLDYFKVETSVDCSFYIAQQLAPGQSLAVLVENGWFPGEKEARNIAIQILEILIYLHSFTPPVIHRDIKPQNIILNSDGKVFLVDFGAVADAYHNSVTGGSTVVGTFGYMAPEQFRGNAVPSTDLYGLGTTLLYLLTGISPADFPQRKLKIDFRRYISVSDNFNCWLDKILEPTSYERFSSAKQALAVLKGEAEINASVKRYQRPKNSGVSIRTSESQLEIEIPAAYIRNNFSLVFALFFLISNGLLSLAVWIFAVEYLFFSSIFILLLSLVALLFYLVYGLPSTLRILNAFILSPLSRTRVCINEEYFWVEQSFLNKYLREIIKITLDTGKVDITGIKLIEVCRFSDRVQNQYHFGAFLTKKEKKWLVGEMKAFLQRTTESRKMSRNH
jgi:eukaryotic-like serine/threonine-protein kinase